MKTRLGLLVAGLALGVTVSGGADLINAAQSDRAGVGQVTVCVGKKQTVVAADRQGRCPRGTRAVAVNRVGRPGPVGPQGRRGPVGPRGPAGGDGTASGPDVAAVGDSLTAGAGGGGTTYPDELQALMDTMPSPGVVRNLGVGGETSATIAGRAGGRPWQAVVVGGRIPASGDVKVLLSADTGDSVDPLLQGANGVNPVVIGGVTGNLSHRADGYWFTREQAGAEVAAPAPLGVVTSGSRDVQDDIVVMWWGTNDGTNDATDIIARERATVDAMTDGDRRYLVLGLTTGDAAYRAPMDAQFLAAFGHRFVNVRAHLTDPDVLAAAGVQLGAADRDQVRVGTVPGALRVDATHLNATGYRLVADLVWQRMVELGWQDAWR